MFSFLQENPKKTIPKVIRRSSENRKRKFWSSNLRGTLVAHKKPYLIIEHAGILMEKNKRTCKNLCNKRTCWQKFIKVVKISIFYLIKNWKNYRKLPNKRTWWKNPKLINEHAGTEVHLYKRTCATIR